MSNGTKTRKHDWGLFASGILLLICAFVIMLWPGITLVTMGIIAGILLIIAGVSIFATYMRTRNTAIKQSGWVLANAILDIILGAMFLIWPVAAAATIPWLAGVFMVAYGIMAIISSIAVRQTGSMWILMLINGILSIIIGIMFVMDPGSFVIFVSIYLIMRGVIMMIYGIIAPRNLPYM